MDIEEVLQKIIDNAHFSRFELDEKRSYQTGIPKAHYFFYYQSELNQKANYILLDILLEDNLYGHSEPKGRICPRLLL